MAVIELGLVHGDGDEPAADPPRRPLGRGDVRRVLAAVVAAVTLLTVTGSARPDPGGLPQLWSIPFQQESGTFMLSADSIYVLNQLGQDAVTAYDLRTGAVRWSRPTPEESTWLSDIEAGAVLVPAGLTTAQYTEADGSTVTRDINRDTVAYDTVTGRELWHEPGELVTTAGDKAVLAEWDKAGDKVAVFRAVRLRDGGTVWSHPARDVETLVTENTPTTTIAERLVTVTDQGRAEVLDLADGAVLATGTLPWLSPSSQENDSTSVSVEGRQLYLDRVENERSTVTAYDTETLRQLWSLRSSATGGAYGCGPVLCLNAMTETTGHDRRTGELRWRIPGAAYGFPLQDGVLMVDDDETGARHHLIDAATGRRIADLGTATPVWDYLFRATPYVIARSTSAGDLMLISRVDERTGEVLLRGTLPAVLDGCQSNGPLVVCITQDNRLIVTDAG